LKFTLDGEEVLEREVKPMGNTAHAQLPRSWLGRRVKVILLKDE
jgi:putative transposon-encoded protein